jgi:tripartite-type tricarboxylate transporter receptor subunit TctC
MDQYKTPESARRLTNVFLDAGRFGSWPIVTAPGVRDEGIKMLRAAFMKTVADANFLDEAKKKQLDIEPITGEELQTLAKEVMAQPPETIERLKKLLGK